MTMELQKGCLLYGEGGSDKKFLSKLKGFLRKKPFCVGWNIDVDNAHGCAPSAVVDMCIGYIQNKEFDLVICFIDVDKLHSEVREYNKHHKHGEKDVDKEIERVNQLAKSKDIAVFWQNANLEDEQQAVFEKHGMKINGKSKIQEVALENINLFVNEKHWNFIKDKITNLN